MGERAREAKALREIHRASADQCRHMVGVQSRSGRARGHFDACDGTLPVSLPIRSTLPDVRMATVPVVDDLLDALDHVGTRPGRSVSAHLDPALGEAAKVAVALGLTESVSALTGSALHAELKRLALRAALDEHYAERPADRPRLVDPYDARAPLEARVKSYLHVNCSVCHVKEGGGNSRMELDLDTPARRMNIIDEVPVHDRLGIADARLVAPGAPEQSVLFQRISRRNTGKMPPLGSNEVDRDALGFIGDWIRGLAPGAAGARP